MARNYLPSYRPGNPAVGNTHNYPGPTLPYPTANLVLDLNADLVAGNDGDVVGTWVNQGPNGSAGDFTQATGSKKPIVKRNVINGHSTVMFDGVDDSMTSTLLVSDGTRSVYCVLKALTSAPSAQSVYQFLSATPHYSLLQLMNFGVYSPYSLQFDGTNSTACVGIADAINTNPHILGAIYNGGGNSTPGNYAINLDGTNKTVAAGGSFSGTAAGGSCIGARVNGGSTLVPYNGHLARLLVFNANLSPTDSAAVITYLRGIYGI